MRSNLALLRVGRSFRLEGVGENDITGPLKHFEIHESREDGGVRLVLTGELDLRSVTPLDHRLTSLRVMRTPVCLDLSQLQFIDSTGLSLLIRTVGDARIKKWQFVIDPNLTPQVRGLFKLARLEYFLIEDDSTTAEP